MNVKIALVMSAGRRQRQHDRPVRPQVPAAVEARRLVQLLRQPSHELEHQEDEEGVGGQVLAEEQRRVGVDEFELLEQHVLRDEQHVVRQEQRADHRREEQSASGEADLGEGVGRERAGEHHADDRTDRQEKGVAEEGGDGDVGDAVGETPVVVGDGVGGEEGQAADDLVVRLEGTADDPHHGVEDDREDGERPEVPGERARRPLPRGARGGACEAHRAPSS